MEGVATGPANEVAVVGTVSDQPWLRLYDQDGEEQWTIAPPEPNGSYLAVGIDGAGDVVVAGLDGADIGIVRKYSSTGTLRWSIEFEDFLPEALAIDGNSNIVIVGNGGEDAWVRKLAP